MPTRPLDILNCTSEEFFHQMVITKKIFKDTVVSNSRGCRHCKTTLQIECWKNSHPARLREVNNKGKARLHLKYHDLDIM